MTAAEGTRTLDLLHGNPSQRCVRGSIAKESSSARFSLQFFGYRDQRGVAYRFLNVAVVAAKGGGSAVRVDGVAVWEPRAGTSPCLTIY